MSVEKKTHSGHKSPTSFQHRVEEREGYLYVFYKGRITSQALAEIMDANYSNPRFKEMNDLWDLREAHSDEMDYGRIRNLVEHIQKRGTRLHKRSAIVVNGEFHFGLSKIYESLAGNLDQSHLSVQVWQDIDAAKAWLQELNPSL